MEARAPRWRLFYAYRREHDIAIRVTTPPRQLLAMTFVWEDYFLDALRREWNSPDGGPWRNVLLYVPEGYSREGVLESIEREKHVNQR
jgi:hypothetical protein